MVLGLFSLTYSIMTSIVSVLLALVASGIIFELNRNKETAMRRFHLNQEESVMDFKVFMYVNLLMVSAYVLFWVGTIGNIEVLTSLNKYLITLYGVFMTLLFARWWERFR
ncbi:MAG: hypothetical protein ABEJ93_04445 [Candidatus Nanohalobium sp.]